MTELPQKDCEKVIDRRVCRMVLLERESESVRFVRIERHIPSVEPVCDFFFQRLKRGKRLQTAYLKEKGCHDRGWGHQQIDKRDYAES